jgi:hypothetical protein
MVNQALDHMENLNEYSKSTKNVCLCTTISIILILLFIITPLNNYYTTSIIGKLIICLILIYALYKNVKTTNDFSKKIFLIKGEWNNLKTNVVCSYIFSLFILLLLITVIKKIL